MRIYSDPIYLWLSMHLYSILDLVKCDFFKHAIFFLKDMPTKALFFCIRKNYSIRLNARYRLNAIVILSLSYKIHKYNRNPKNLSIFLQVRFIHIRPIKYKKYIRYISIMF